MPTRLVPVTATAKLFWIIYTKLTQNPSKAASEPSNINPEYGIPRTKHKKSREQAVVGLFPALSLLFQCP